MINNFETVYKNNQNKKFNKKEEEKIEKGIKSILWSTSDFESL